MLGGESENGEAVKQRGDWVVAGGRFGETGHCTRCGDGLSIGSQRLEVALAAMRAFVKIHARCKPGKYRESSPTLSSWLNSRDTGVSSATIYFVFTSLSIGGVPQGSYEQRDPPRDPSDFGRCYRLLGLAPEWEGRLGEVAERFPAWEPFVREWPKLKKMYEEAVVSGEGHGLHGFIQELTEESGRIKP